MARGSPPRRRITPTAITSRSRARTFKRPLILILREAKQALEGERAAQAKPVPRERSARLAEYRHRLRQGWELERRVVAEHADWLRRGSPATVRGA
jgi:hypothetical protein